MPDSMTFKAREADGLCELCAMHPATLQFDILSERENSLQEGACCPDCAHNLINALAQIKP